MRRDQVHVVTDEHLVTNFGGYTRDRGSFVSRQQQALPVGHVTYMTLWTTFISRGSNTIDTCYGSTGGGGGGEAQRIGRGEVVVQQQASLQPPLSFSSSASHLRHDVDHTNSGNKHTYSGHYGRVGSCQLSDIS